MGNWAQLYADLTAQLQAGQALGFWDNAFVGFYQSFVAAGRWRLYLNGLLTTLEATILALLLGVVLGVVVAVIRTAHDQQRAGHKNVILGVFNAICKIYTTIIRGTPMLLQLYFFFFALPALIPALNKQKFLCIAIALVCNSAAYVSEVIRSGIQSVDAGQSEAAMSLGMNSFQRTWYILVPQALKTILPALGNEFIMIVKDTSLASTFFIGDLMTQYLIVRGASYLPLEPLVIVGVIYFILTFLLSKLFGFFERRMSRADR